MAESHESTNRFVCPNDRQLALRAKLKTGWSIKTGSFGYHNTGRANSTSCLEPEEQAAILEVIQRAEQLELKEQERVGKLVDRLETMRKNALGRSSSQCLLCGDKFGILGAQSVECISCKKLVCQKCAIEAWIGIRRFVPTTGSLKNRGEKSLLERKHYCKDQWLCKICAETREIWKKSGAWFFKGLPKYILPGQEIKKGTKSKSPPKSFKINDDTSSSSEDENPGFLSTKIRTHSFSETTTDGTVNDPSPGQYSRQTSSSDSQKSSTYFGDIKRDNTGENKYDRYERERSMSRVDKWDEETALAAASGGYVSIYSSNMYLGDFSRRDSICETTWTEEKTSPSALSVSSGASTLNYSQKSNNPPYSKHSPPAINPPQEEISPSSAFISLTLTYDTIRDTLHCLIHRAKNLPPMDINGLTDPFCKLNILPDRKTSTKLKTKTVHKTRNPEFNESLTFYEISENDLLRKSLHVLMLDDDKYGKDYLGEAKVSLAGLRVQKSISMTIPLERLISDISLGPDMDLPAWYEDPWGRGQILISLSYNTKRRALLVTVIRCANLLPMDNNGFSDPFVKLHLKPDPHHKKHKSSIKWKNLNPYYNEEFAFETRPNELSTQSLYITVWDKDYGKSNDYLGGLILGGGSKGRRLKHWLDMIRYPDHRHEYWHNLTEDLLTD